MSREFDATSVRSTPPEPRSELIEHLAVLVVRSLRASEIVTEPRLDAQAAGGDAPAKHDSSETIA